MVQKISPTFAEHCFQFADFIIKQKLNSLKNDIYLMRKSDISIRIKQMWWIYIYNSKSFKFRVRVLFWVIFLFTDFCFVFQNQFIKYTPLNYSGVGDGFVGDANFQSEAIDGLPELEFSWSRKMN